MGKTMYRAAVRMRLTKRPPIAGMRAMARERGLPEPKALSAEVRNWPVGGKREWVGR